MKLINITSNKKILPHFIHLCILAQKFKTLINQTLLFLFTDSVHKGATLRLHRVNRKHMGDYVCVASNGIPPDESWTIKLLVLCAFFCIFRFFSSFLKQFLLFWLCLCLLYKLFNILLVTVPTRMLLHLSPSRNFFHHQTPLKLTKKWGDEVKFWTSMRSESWWNEKRVFGMRRESSKGKLGIYLHIIRIQNRQRYSLWAKYLYGIELLLVLKFLTFFR